MIHRLYVLDALSLEPVADLEGGDNGGAGAFRDLDHIGDVIAVTVRDEDEIGRDLARCRFLRASGLGVMKGSKSKVFPPATTAKQACP